MRTATVAAAGAWTVSLALYGTGLWLCAHGATEPSWRGIPWAAWTLCAGIVGSCAAAGVTMHAAFQDQARTHRAREPFDPSAWAPNARGLFEAWRNR